MADPSALDSYHTTTLTTDSDSGLIVRLYEGVFRFLQEAEDAVRDGAPKAKGVSLRRAGRIIEELNGSLDHEVGGEISRQLAALYDYANYELTEANLSNDTRHIENVRRVFNILLEAWRKVHASGASAETAPSVPTTTDTGADSLSTPETPVAPDGSPLSGLSVSA